MNVLIRMEFEVSNVYSVYQNSYINNRYPYGTVSGTRAEWIITILYF